MLRDPIHLRSCFVLRQAHIYLPIHIVCYGKINIKEKRNNDERWKKKYNLQIIWHCVCVWVCDCVSLFVFSQCKFGRCCFFSSFFWFSFLFTPKLWDYTNARFSFFTWFIVNRCWMCTVYRVNCRKEKKEEIPKV